jgi:hypothetical protein
MQGASSPFPTVITKREEKGKKERKRELCTDDEISRGFHTPFFVPLVSVDFSGNGG